jgi:hypothetical protein
MAPLPFRYRFSYGAHFGQFHCAGKLLIERDCQTLAASQPYFERAVTLERENFTIGDMPQFIETP